MKYQYKERKWIVIARWSSYDDLEDLSDKERNWVPTHRRRGKKLFREWLPSIDLKENREQIREKVHSAYNKKYIGE
jgi:hypothetical protein